MDEAQEKIVRILEDYSLELDSSGQGIIENYYYFRELAKRVDGAGYRKLPEDKPPLQKGNPYSGYDDHRFGSEAVAYENGKEAQREADIKHYEG